MDRQAVAGQKHYSFQLCMLNATLTRYFGSPTTPTKYLGMTCKQAQYRVAPQWQSFHSRPLGSAAALARERNLRKAASSRV